jgi:putative ABC transport system permease protein
MGSLQLARASGRQKEFAIRVALGASRARIVQQLLTESVLLALLGGMFGVALAWLGIRMLGPQLPGQLGTTTTLDMTVLFYSLVVSVLAGVLTGFAPAFHTSSASLTGSLKEGGKGQGTGSSGGKLRSVLTVAEIALSLVLLIGAGLLLRSFQLLLQVEPGFEARNVLTLRLSLPKYSYPDAARQSAFYSKALERVSTLPGMKAAGGINGLPLIADRDSTNLT